MSIDAPTGSEVEVPELVRRRADHLGAEGRQWLSALPDLIAAVEHDWSVTVGRPLGGGSASYVALARTAGGIDAVLKLSLPDSGFAGQVRTIETADGRGYVRLLEHDVERHAMLLEALGPSMDRLDLPPERQLEALGETLRLAWTAPGPAGAPAGQKADQLRQLVVRLWEELGRPCSERVLSAAVRCAERRAGGCDPAGFVVVHGDPHPGNALRVRTPRPGAESGFVFVDPDGFLDDPAYDLGVALRDWCLQLLAGDAPAVARRYCRLLAAGAGLDETAVWEWGFLERVSSGLYLMDVGAVDDGRRFLATAERLV